MQLDKKNRDDRLRLILLDEIGSAVVHTCPADDIRAILGHS